MYDLSFTDYLAILKRRKTAFLSVAGALLVFSMLFALNWSNYRAEATVEIAQSHIDTTSKNADQATSIADLRISRIQQKILSTGILVNIIKMFDLYPDEQSEDNMSNLAQRMRDNIKISLVGGQLSNPASAHKASANQLSAIAFTLSFNYPEPALAQAITKELITRFIDEDIHDRRANAAHASKFLEKQIDILEESLVEQEEMIADFRLENGDTRPEARTFNKQAAASTLMSLQSINSQITSNLGTQGTLRSQLAATSPYSRTMADGQILTTPAVQLKALESEYATLTAKYSDEHPDVLKIKRQIKALQPLVPSASNKAMLRAKIADATVRYKASKESNGQWHPDVVALQNKIEKYKKELAAQPKREKNTLIKSDADNPAYLQIVTQLRAVQEQHESLRAQKSDLRKEQLKYSEAVDNNPIAEQQFASLSRDYDNTLSRYRELKEKKLQADMRKAIEEGGSGDRLIITTQPEIPNGTTPARKSFALAGILLSLIGGVMGAFAVQLLSQSVVGPRHLSSVTGREPLVCVPHIQTQAEKEQRDRWKEILKDLLIKFKTIRLGALNNG